MHFLVNHISPHIVNLIYQTIHIIPTVITYHIQYNYIDIHILIPLCNTFVTIIISIIYRYNISIKTCNNQYRYKHTDSMIRIIPKNTEMYIYTVYT